MNIELKAMLTVVFKLFSLGKDLVAKAGIVQDMTDLESLGLSIPAVISGFSDAQSEVLALDQPANLADILAFISVSFAGIDSDAKAQAILSAALNLASGIALNGYQLAEAIKG